MLNVKSGLFARYRDLGNNPGTFFDIPPIESTLAFPPNIIGKESSTRNQPLYDHSKHGLLVQDKYLIDTYVNAFIEESRLRNYEGTPVVEYRNNPKPEVKSVLLKIVTRSNQVSLYLSLGTSARSPNAYVIIPTNEPARSNIEKSLTNNGFALGSTSSRRNRSLSVKMPKNNDDHISKLDSFWNLVDIIELMGNDFEAVGKRGSRRHLTRRMTTQNYYLGAASSIYVATRFGLGHLLPRGGRDGNIGTFDVNDRLITIGTTKAALLRKHEDPTYQPYREHAVPCKVIVDGAIESYTVAKFRLSLEALLDVAEIIKNNLFIVLCTNEEAKFIDQERMLREKMPKGWLFGDNPLARFEDAKIDVFSLDGRNRLLFNRQNLMRKQ